MKRLFYWLMATLTTIMAVAQEKSTEVDININKDKGGSFWEQPWVWIVGAAIFILLLVAISRRGSRE